MKQSLISLIETGSYTSSMDLDNLVKALQERVRIGKKKIKRGLNSFAISEDVRKAEIFLEEFKSLRDSL